MKKSIYSKLLLTSLFVSGVFAGSNTISAKETSSATTDATATFVPDDGATSPVNPTDPSQPGDSSDTGNHSTGNTGLLTLDVAPSKFDFGSYIPASNSAMTINALSSGKDSNQYLQVSDKRTENDENSSAGWKVNIKSTQFSNQDVGNLTDATITIPKGTARNSQNDPATAIDNNLQTFEVSNLGLNDTDQTIFKAPSGGEVGKSTSTDTLNSNDVKLNIPKETAMPGSFTATVNWSLVDGADD